MAHPRVSWLDHPEEGAGVDLLPLYPLTEGLKQYQVRRIVTAALEDYADALEEVFPESLLASLDLQTVSVQCFRG